jgi:hypothetical protein
MMQAPQAQMYQPQNPAYAPLPAHSLPGVSPLVTGESQKKNRPWVIPTGLHIVFMLSFVVYAFVLALFDPEEFENENFVTIFWYMLAYNYSLYSTVFTQSAGIVSAISVSFAIKNKCYKSLAVVLTVLSYFTSIMLLALLTSSLNPESFSEGWEGFFNAGFLQTVVPQLSAHILIGLGVVLLMVLGKEE